MALFSSFAAYLARSDTAVLRVVSFSLTSSVPLTETLSFLCSQSFCLLCSKAIGLLFGRALSLFFSEALGPFLLLCCLFCQIRYCSLTGRILFLDLPNLSRPLGTSCATLAQEGRPQCPVLPRCVLYDELMTSQRQLESCRSRRQRRGPFISTHGPAPPFTGRRSPHQPGGTLTLLLSFDITEAHVRDLVHYLMPLSAAHAPLPPALSPHHHPPLVEPLARRPPVRTPLVGTEATGADLPKACFLQQATRPASSLPKAAMPLRRRSTLRTPLVNASPAIAPFAEATQHDDPATSARTLFAESLLGMK